MTNLDALTTDNTAFCSWTELVAECAAGYIPTLSTPSERQLAAELERRGYLTYEPRSSL